MKPEQREAKRSLATWLAVAAVGLFAACGSGATGPGAPMADAPASPASSHAAAAGGGAAGPASIRYEPVGS